MDQSEIFLFFLTNSKIIPWLKKTVSHQLREVKD